MEADRCPGWSRSASTRRGGGLLAGLLVLTAGAAAQAAPGDLLVAEPEQGAVLEFSAGGDLSRAERFATGLSDPLGMCVGPGGEIYVAESATGEITIITEGGDFTGATPFASGPFTPVELYCTETMILVATPIAVPVVADITDGGNIAETFELYATGLPAPIDLARDAEGSLFSANFDVFDVTMPGDFMGATPFATGRSISTLTFTGSALWGGDSTAPEIYDLSAGGDLSAAAPAVTLPLVGMGHIDGLLAAADGSVYAATGDALYEVSAGGDLSAARPFATGVLTGERGFVGMLEHVCSADADCTDADACNGVEQCVDNECVAAPAPLDCDDGDACTADACDPAAGCTHEALASCCDEDLDCAVEELCDLEAMTCVPVGAITTGEDDTTAGESSGGEASSGGGTGEQPTGGTGAAAAGADGEGGCGCSSHRDPPGWLGFLMLAVLARRRRHDAR